MAEFWKKWKRISKLEETAIKAIRRAKKLLLKEIGKENIHAIYLKGSFVRREMNKKSDVDMVPIAKENKYLNKILELKRKNRKYISPVDIVPLSIWELKNKKRYHARKEKGPKGAPAIDEFVRYRLLWGRELNPCSFPKREPKDRLRGLVKAWKNIFLPYYEKGVFSFEQIIKQVFWLTEYEQMSKGKKHTHTWKELVKSVKNKKHPVHDAWKYRQKPPKDEKVKKKFIEKMKKHLGKLGGSYSR